MSVKCSDVSAIGNDLESEYENEISNVYVRLNQRSAKSEKQKR